MGITERKLVHEDKSGRIYWDALGQWVELEAIQYASGPDFRSILERALQALKERRSNKMLADISRIGLAFSAEDMIWTETDWFPRCIKAGMKYFAMVMPKALAVHMSVDKFSQKFDPDAIGYIRRFFTDAEEARKWLRQQK